MIKRASILGNGRSVALLFVILVIFLSTSLALASNTTSPVQSVPLPANEFVSQETNLKPEIVQNVLPSNCTEGIVNGGFEDLTGWTTPATEYTAGYTTELVRSGASSMRTGIVDTLHNRYSYSSAVQMVTLPADADYITLKFWIFPQTGEDESIPLILPKDPLGIREADAATVSDWQFVFILNKYGQELERLLYRRQNVTTWQYHSFDLSHLKNQGMIKVYFDTFNNGRNGVTSMHIDDVSLELCTGTPPPDPDGSIAGTVSLQGRTDHSGAQVCADDGGTPVCVQSNAAGAYSIDVPAGSYDVTVDMERYLDAAKLNVPVTGNAATNLQPVTCLGGDTNDDCVVNILDLSLVGGRFGTACGDPLWDVRADINDDCVINILDLSVTGGNFDETCPVPWS